MLLLRIITHTHMAKLARRLSEKENSLVASLSRLLLSTHLYNNSKSQPSSFPYLPAKTTTTTSFGHGTPLLVVRCLCLFCTYEEWPGLMMIVETYEAYRHLYVYVYAIPTTRRRLCMCSQKANHFSTTTTTTTS